MLVDLSTVQGRLCIETDDNRAPVSSANFLSYVDRGFLNHSAIERIVTPRNDQHPHYKIGAIQWGIRDPNKVFPPIALETTQATGLAHKHGTVSVARPEGGKGQSIFFICVGDQPCLDYGGHRFNDRQGFAAFAQVVEGLDVIRSIYDMAEECDYLSSPLAINHVTRR